MKKLLLLLAALMSFGYSLSHAGCGGCGSCASKTSADKETASAHSEGQDNAEEGSNTSEATH